MSVDIYYFSGTGNTFYAAKYLSGKIGANLIPVAKALKTGKTAPAAESVGIVFPVYFASNKDGVPHIVKRFVESLKGIESKYIFAVCTSGYMPGTAIGSLAKRIKARGGKLASGFVVNMAQSSLKEELAGKAKRAAGKDAEDEKKKKKNVKGPETKLDMIAQRVLSKESTKLETRGLISKILNVPLRVFMKPIFLFRYSKLAGRKSANFWDLLPYCDNGFEASDACTGCGICVKVCPVGNIKIAEGKPVWQHRCENCLACYVWCPQKAICGEIVKYNPNTHHPEIELSDML